jgi:hypothetical protein
MRNCVRKRGVERVREIGDRLVGERFEGGVAAVARGGVPTPLKLVHENVARDHDDGRIGCRRAHLREREAQQRGVGVLTVRRERLRSVGENGVPAFDRRGRQAVHEPRIVERVEVHVAREEPGGWCCRCLRVRGPRAEQGEGENQHSNDGSHHGRSSLPP